MIWKLTGTFFSSHWRNAPALSWVPAGGAMCLSKLQSTHVYLTFPSMAIQLEPAAFTASCRGVTTRKTDALTPPLCPAFSLFHSFVGLPQRYFIPMRALSGAPTSLQSGWLTIRSGNYGVSAKTVWRGDSTCRIFHACYGVWDYYAKLMDWRWCRNESHHIAPVNF